MVETRLTTPAASLNPTLEVTRELIISPESIRLLVENVKPLIESPSLATVLSTVAAVAAALAAVFSLVVAIKQTQISRETFLFNLHQMFFNLVSGLPRQDDNSKLSKHDKQLVANFNELVSWSLAKKKLTKNDAELFVVNMKLPIIVEFVKERRNGNGNETYKYYWKWLSENGVIES